MHLLYALAALAASTLALAIIAPAVDSSVKRHEILLLSRAVVEGDYARLSFPVTVREAPIYVAENCTAYSRECSNCVRAYAVLINVNEVPSGVKVPGSIVLLGSSSAVILPDICGTRQLVIYRVEGGACTSNFFKIVEWVIDGPFVIEWLNATKIRYRLILCSE